MFHHASFLLHHTSLLLSSEHVKTSATDKHAVVEIAWLPCDVSASESDISLFPGDY